MLYSTCSLTWCGAHGVEQAEVGKSAPPRKLIRLWSMLRTGASLLSTVNIDGGKKKLKLKKNHIVVNTRREKKKWDRSW